MEYYEKLYQAIKNDNVKEFKDCMEINYCGSLRLGRFPVLSVMYLYNSVRLLRAYEKKFLKHNSWQDVGEPMEIAAKFRSVAGKCLRLYLGETVSPLEMLLLMDRNTRLKQVFKDAHITAPVKQRLKDIYYIRWGLEADFVRGKIVLQRRPLTRREKWTWVMRATCMVLCLALLATTPFAVNAFAPFITDASGVLNVSGWNQIDFSSNKVYALKKDVTVPTKFFAKEMNCELRGNGHTVTVKSDSVFGEIKGNVSDVTVVTNGALLADNVSGTLSNVVFETDGSPIVNTVLADASVSDVTVNAKVDLSVEEEIGFFANDNYAIISNVVVNVTGQLKAVATAAEDEQTEDASFNCGGILARNHIVYDVDRHKENVINCTANYNNFVLVGQSQANAAFGGIVGTNEGVINDCKTNGAIISDTFDVAGICADNYQWLSACESNVDISQSTSVHKWNPIASGIAINNYYVIDNCVNRGNIKSVSTAPLTDENREFTAYATGIAYHSVSQTTNHAAYLQFCTNYGDVSASASFLEVNAAGLCNLSNGFVSFCINNGKISATGTKLVEAAGVINFSVKQTSNSVNYGEISAQSQEEVRAGGIVSSYCNVVANCFSFGNIDARGKICYAGGIWGYSMNYSYEDSYGHKGLYCGVIIDSIAACNVNVNVIASSGSFAAVGGIVGAVSEDETYIGGTGEKYYVGGAIIGGYFIGKLQVSGKAYVGAIAGVVGERIYLATQNTTNVDEKNFYDNFYVNDCGVEREFGVALDADGNYKTVENVGAKAATKQEITSDKLYVILMEELEKILAGNAEK